MKLVAFDELQHYPHLLIWWSERGYASTPVHLLSSIGLVALTEADQPVVAGFLYCSEGGVAQISHLVADKQVPQAIRSPMLDQLILALLGLAQRRGFRQIAGATNLPHLVERYKRLGFSTTDEHVTVLVKEF